MSVHAQKTNLALDPESPFFVEQVDRKIEQAIPHFRRLVRAQTLFHLFFSLSGLISLALFFLFLTTIVERSLVAVSLSALFLVFFSYFILRFYVRDRTREKIHRAVFHYVDACKQVVQFDQTVPEHHLALGSALSRFANQMYGKELSYYPCPDWLDFIRPTCERFSVYCHAEHVAELRESLLIKNVECHLEVVKLEPVHLEVHVALANAYILLSSLYARREEGDEEKEERFRITVERAMEEFKILKDFAPDDPWVHIQLAYSYRDLGLPAEEIAEYETILRLCPGEKEVLYRLGVLYFEEGMNAKGLQMYEELRKTNYKQAQQLIAHYGDTWVSA